MQILRLQLNRKSVICHRISQLQLLYIMTLTYIFKETNFEMWISRKRWKLVQRLQRFIFATEWDHCKCCPTFSMSNFSSSWKNANITIAFRWEVRYLYHDLDLQFQCHDILNVNIPKTVTTFAQMRRTSFTEVDISYSDLNLHFKGKIFTCYAFIIENCAISGCSRQICINSHGTSRGVDLVISVNFFLLFQ